jgi:hypothetical protein
MFKMLYLGNYEIDIECYFFLDSKSPYVNVHFSLISVKYGHDHLHCV